nr:DMT family transporter [Candidatus Sigynarchaeota archaeon]
MQKKGADQVPSVHTTAAMKSIKNFLTNKTWMLGYVFITIGSLINFIVLGYGDISVLQPLMAVGIIVQALVCKWYLKEKITRPMIVTMALIMVGVVLVGISSVSGSQNDFSTVLGMLVRPFPLIFVIALATFGAFSYIYTKKHEYKHADIWISNYTGIYSVFSYLFAKILLAAIIQYGFSIALFSDVFAWIILAIMLYTSTSAFITKNVSYQHGRAVLINNIFNAFNISLPVLVGVVVFDEWADMSPINIALQTVGVAIIMAGIALMMVYELRFKREDTSKLIGEKKI